MKKLIAFLFRHLAILVLTAPLFSMEIPQQKEERKKLPLAPAVTLPNGDRLHVTHNPVVNELTVFINNTFVHASRFPRYDLSTDIQDIQPQGLITLAGKPLAIFIGKDKNPRDSFFCIEASNAKPFRAHIGMRGKLGPMAIKNIKFHELANKNLQVTLLIKCAGQLKKIRHDLTLMNDGWKTVKEYYPVLPQSQQLNKQEVSPKPKDSCINQVD